MAGQLADRFVFLAFPLVAIVWLKAGEFEIGVLTAMTTAGSLLIGLPAGAWVDRHRKRPVMIGMDLSRAALLAAVPVAWWAGVLTIELLFAIALLHGLLTVLFDVGYQSFLPTLVGRNRLVEGNAKIAATRSAVSVSGPALAGPVVAWLGAPFTVLLSCAGMLISALTAARIRTPEPAPHPTATPGATAEGLRFVLSHPLLRPILITDAIFSLSLVTYQTMLLVFLSREAGLSPSGVGLVLSAVASGGLTGALLSRRVITRLGAGRAIWLSPLLTAPAGALMPLSLWPGVMALSLLSAGGVIRLIAQSGLQQSVTPDHLLGRMTAIFRFVQWGAMPLAALLAGALGAWLGPAAVLFIGSAGMTAAFLPAMLSPLRDKT